MSNPTADRSPVTAAIQRHVDAGAIAGAATLVWRRGEVTQSAAVGRRDLATGAAVERDTLFRIASMTKPVTTVAALMLLDEGRFQLDDPIIAVAPELAEVRVLSDPNGPLDSVVDAVRPITFDDLLTHRAGLTYADFHRGPIGAAYRDALGPSVDNALTPDEWIARLGTLPLIDQPGAAFHYGHSTDLLGFLIARMEGTSLGSVLARRIFAPLGMHDTGFTVPPDKRARRAGLCGFDEAGHLTAIESTPGRQALANRPDDMTFESGGQGLWTTVDDYLAFARLFIGGGAVDGVRLLEPATLARMTSNQLTPQQRAASKMFGRPLFAAGHGYGFGVAVVLEPELADPLRCGGGEGSVGWPGAWGGWWQADPNDASIQIFLAHNMPDLHQMASGVGLGVWSAIAEFHELASGA
jgi:CubicO group peptidase (beta-lactamase class C family)